MHRSIHHTYFKTCSHHQVSAASAPRCVWTYCTLVPVCIYHLFSIDKSCVARFYRPAIPVPFCLDVRDHLISIGFLDEASCADPLPRPYFVASLDSILFCALGGLLVGYVLALPKLPYSSCLNPVSHRLRKSFSNSGDRGSRLVSVRVALAACSLATPDPATRSSADVVLCYYCLRLPTTHLQDLVHHRPGHRDLVRELPTRKECIVTRFGRPAFHKWTCKEAVIRDSEGGREPRPPSVVATGKVCPAVKSHPILPGGYVRRNPPARARLRTVPVCQHYSRLARSPGILAKPKIKEQGPRLWELPNLRPQGKGEVVSATHREKALRIQGNVSRRRDTLRQRPPLLTRFRERKWRVNVSHHSPTQLQDIFFNCNPCSMICAISFPLLSWPILHV